MKTRVWVVAGIVTSLIFSAPLRSATAAAVSAPFELTDGVIVDSARGALYLMSPDHGIDAINLASGKIVWHTAGAAKPLLLFDDRLVAQAENPAAMRVLRVVVLNTAMQGEPVTSAAVPLPAPAFASIDSGMGTSFTADARPLSRGEIQVWWRFAQRAVSGFLRPSPAPMLEINGAARIDLETAQVQVLPTRDAAVQPRPTANGGLPTDIKLEPGFNLAIVSADGQTILANKPAGTDATGWMDYLWAIYSLRTRARLAEIRMPTSAAPFFVWNSMLLYVSRPYGRRVDGKWLQEPLELRAVDLSGGREAWKTPIRDTAYHGPFPPRP
jgi:hypothetical protein